MDLKDYEKEEDVKEDFETEEGETKSTDMKDEEEETQVVKH